MYGPSQSLDNLLQLSQTVYYSRGYEKKERERKTEEQAEALALAQEPFGLGLTLSWSIIY